MFECLGWVVGGGGGVWKKECLKSVLQQGREQEKGRSPLAETNYIFRRRVPGHQVVGRDGRPARALLPPLLELFLIFSRTAVPAQCVSGGKLT